MFETKAAAAGGVVRRSLRHADRIVRRDRPVAEGERRGVQAIANGDQLIVTCTRMPVRRPTAPPQVAQ